MSEPHATPANATARRADRARKRASAPFFFGRQTLLFMIVCVALIVLDLFLYIGIAIYDSNLNFGNGSPKSVTAYVGDALAHGEDGSYTLPEDAIRWMDAEKCWSMLLSQNGEVLWSYQAPESVLHSYTLADVAVFSRMGYLEDYPCFVWQRDDGLLVTGFPKDSYAMNVINYLPQQSMVLWPLYILIIFLVDAAVLFLVYSISRQRVAKSIAPMIEALDDLARDRPAHVQLKGSLRDVGESINAASAIMRRKDEARKRWVTGVSHDIRTPLAISLGHAEGIAHDKNAPDDVRERARVIVRQSERIRDLVADLNIASKLEYDMQPVDTCAAHPARIVRGIAADYANTYVDGRFAFEADVDEAAERLEMPLDERLIDRALRNLANNAIRHNDEGCTIGLVARVRGDETLIGVTDDGTGISQQALTRLNQEAESIARLRSAEDAFIAQGPLPPPHFAEYRPDAAEQLAKRNAFCENADARADEKEREESGCAPSLTPKDLVGINEHGLGLSLVARIAAAHGGHVEFAESESGGFSALMALPIGDADETQNIR